MKRINTFLLSGAVAVGLFAIIGASPALAAKGGGSTTSASCPKGDAGLQPDPKVGASYSTDASGVTTYQLFSQDQDAVNGVPGLIKYCVYPHGATGAPTVTVDAKGGSAEDVPWVANTSSKKPYNFSFSRPGGNNATNIWFDQDNETTLMGTADWGSGGTPPVPTTQDIVLHVADPSLSARARAPASSSRARRFVAMALALRRTPTTRFRSASPTAPRRPRSPSRVTSPVSSETEWC